ncbi:MAG: hypothetical protein FWD11_01820, partial [Micrococcales bacterium]|nr:hypothetical protein [Micrococcales bacterium]
DPDPTMANNTSSATTWVAAGAQSCPPGWYYDIFAGACIDPNAGGDDGPTPTNPTDTLCSLDGLNYDIPNNNNPGQWLSQQIATSTVVTQTGSYTGYFSQYITPQALFLPGDVSYQVTVAAPAAWATRARTSPFSNLQVVEPGGVIPSASGNVWVGGSHAVTQYDLENPFAVYIAVTRGSGGGNTQATMMVPAVVLLRVQITDDHGETRSLTGFFVTTPITQGSVLPSYGCSNGQPTGQQAADGAYIWNWTQSQLDDLGWWNVGSSSEQATAPAMALLDIDWPDDLLLLVEGGPPDDTVLGDAEDPGEAEDLVEPDEQVPEPEPEAPEPPDGSGGPEVSDAVETPVGEAPVDEIPVEEAPVETPSETKDTVSGTFDPETMTFTLADGTVLTVVSVDVVDGATVITTEDGTTFTTIAPDDPSGTWSRTGPNASPRKRRNP